MAERYNQINGAKDIKEGTIDSTRLTGSGHTKGYVLKVQTDGSLVFEPVMTRDDDLRAYLLDN